MPFGDQRLECRRVRQVDLVDDDDGRYAAFADPAENFRRAVRLLDGIGNVEDHVGVGERSRYELHHRLLELVRRLEDSGRV